MAWPGARVEDPPLIGAAVPLAGDGPCGATVVAQWRIAGSGWDGGACRRRRAPEFDRNGR